MSLDTFLQNLQFNIEKASPTDWEVDWDDAPLTYKLYRGHPVVPFSLELPLTLEGEDEKFSPDFQRIGHYLWYIYGLTQMSESALSSASTEQEVELMQSFRRFVPSGGALYPSELYVYLKLKDLPVGVYHYDTAHHRLILLREGNFDVYLSQALGHRCEMSACFGTIFVSTMFWKNFFKYNNFSYRLQGLDAGVLIGQLLEVGKRFGIESAVYFQFIDLAINHLLGLSDEEESVYAVIPLTIEPANAFKCKADVDKVIYAADLCRELPQIQNNHYVRSKTIKTFPMLKKMNKAAMMDSTETFRTFESKHPKNLESQLVSLPELKQLSYDLASVCQKRYSPASDYYLGKISKLQFATLLQEATSAFCYRNDLDGTNNKGESRVSLYSCLTNVEGIPDGAYAYITSQHSLQQINIADYRPQLQSGILAGNINLFQIPLCLHVVGEVDFYKPTLGYRGYRIQQMEAGILVQKLLLAASAIDLGGHPLLGFDVNLCDQIYKLGLQGKTSLIQIPIGPYRQRPWLRGNLLS
ncbi:SagB family peptide dehydrogenase [Cytobacillus horneckiae]|uniref:SagB family peptide dehydrogenase n=1 Tax=Cytobacillus horneckiae TaxID=549687 RepID=UPI003D1A09A6